MYIYKLIHNNKTSYLIPTAHYNINLLFTKDEIQQLNDIIKNIDNYAFEANIQKDTLSKKDKIPIKDVYSQEDIEKISMEFNKVFKTNITNKDIENKNIMTLIPGPGIGGICCDKNEIMDLYINNLAKKEKKPIIYLDEGKDYKKLIKDMEVMVKMMREHMSKNPLKLPVIKKHISLTKKAIISYKKVFDKSTGKQNKKTKKGKKNNSSHNDKEQMLDNRNKIWADKIAKVINSDKSIAVFVGANHIDTNLSNNIVELLNKNYNIVFNKVKY